MKKRNRNAYFREYAKKLKKETGFSSISIRRYGLKTLQSLEWRCVKCKSEEDLTIHHKDHNGINKAKKGEKMNNDIENLEVICRKCHGKMHRQERNN